MERLPLSVVLIAHNEIHNIRRCLESVQCWVEEIILLVNDCTDGTDLVAQKEFGAKVFTSQWEGYGNQKNRAQTYASQPWILSLDADETVTVELKKAIEKFLENPASHAGAQFPRCTRYLGRWIRHGDWYPDRSLRLFRRSKGRWVGGLVHEKLVVEGKIATLRGDLRHYSYPNLATGLSKIHHFAELFVRKKHELATQPSLFKIAIAAPGHATWTFLRGYFLRQGFRDRFAGLCVAVHSAFATYFKYVLWYESNRPRDGEP
ncbi:MAG: glycosyltransferase family 2 protein [Puniceicoccales bacterium]|jgi:glycosyltransferase involved in cell wall biosynthesis|nr:glycosyltransferase family 2 protein [Puniceicoccales bacterium]